MSDRHMINTCLGSDQRYLDEQTLVNDLSDHVTSRNWTVRCQNVTYEFDYCSGRTDLLGLGNRNLLHAFEAKLQKWRDALDQARKNRSFAHYCYVALPEQSAKRALRARSEFTRFGVGLLVVERDQLKLAIRPKKNDPLLPWLTRQAQESLREPVDSTP